MNPSDQPHPDPLPRQPTTDGWLQQLERGEEQAWDRLFRVYAGLVRRLLEKEFGNVLAPEDLDDAVAIVFATLWSRPGQVHDWADERGQFRPGFPGSALYVRARYRALDLLRRRSHHAWTSLAFGVEVADPQATPQQRAEAAELQRRLDAAEAKLSPDERAVLSAYRERGGGNRPWTAEVGRQLGKSPEAVRMMLVRLQRKLLDALEIPRSEAR